MWTRRAVHWLSEEIVGNGRADDGKIPPITATALTEAGWSEVDLGYSLKTGVKADGDVFGGSMAEVVREGTAYLKQQDLNAIAYYLFNRHETSTKPR